VYKAGQAFHSSAVDKIGNGIGWGKKILATQGVDD
jgi:hypothetical protein